MDTPDVLVIEQSRMHRHPGLNDAPSNPHIRVCQHCLARSIARSWLKFHSAEQAILSATLSGPASTTLPVFCAASKRTWSYNRVASGRWLAIRTGSALVASSSDERRAPSTFC